MSEEILKYIRKSINVIGIYFNIKTVRVVQFTSRINKLDICVVKKTKTKEWVNKLESLKKIK